MVIVIKQEANKELELLKEIPEIYQDIRMATVSYTSFTFSFSVNEKVTLLKLEIDDKCERNTLNIINKIIREFRDSIFEDIDIYIDEDRDDEEIIYIIHGLKSAKMLSQNEYIIAEYIKEVRGI